MEDPFPSSSSLLEMLEYCECEKSSSLGFMELLNMQDFGPTAFDVLQAAVPSADRNSKQESAEVLNAPATPNYSSISSESSDGQKDERASKEVEEEEEEKDMEKTQKNNKQLKPKKTSQKRQREQRFAFMTKSEVDHLEDGYRWRKYGQKAVKNSPFPRSYYRCTNASCNVKKRVERSNEDPSIVVTTYEGQHTHPSPQLPRPAALQPPYSGFSPPRQMVLSHNQRQLINYSVLSNGYVGSTNSGAGGGAQQMSFCSQTPALLTDNGLLQDVVPWSAIKSEEQ